MKERWRRDRRAGASKEEMIKWIGRGRGQLKETERREKKRREGEVKDGLPRRNVNVYHLN